MRLLSYLLTGLLTDLLTEGNFPTYGANYGPTYGIVLPNPQLVEYDPGAAKAGIDQFHKEKY